MKKIVIIGIIAILSSCSPSNVDRKQSCSVLINGYSPLDIIYIDSCQYLFGDWGNATVLTHKGDCNNKKHN